jgi:hypothetical protein
MAVLAKNKHTQRVVNNTPKRGKNSEASVTHLEPRWLASKEDYHSQRNPSLFHAMQRIKEVFQVLKNND